MHLHSAVLQSCAAVSVRLSVTLVYCVETAELIIKQLALDCSLETDTKHGTYIFRESLIGAVN